MAYLVIYPVIFVTLFYGTKMSEKVKVEQKIYVHIKIDSGKITYIYCLFENGNTANYMFMHELICIDKITFGIFVYTFI